MMGENMKKYIIIPLLFLPLMSFAAPAVKKLGVATPVATAGVRPGVAAKVTPARTASVGKVARVGSVQPKPATATSGAISGSTSRFPIVLPGRLYNSASAPRPTGGTTVIDNTDVDLTEINNQISTINTTLSNHENQINSNETTINNLQDSPKFDSISRSALTGDAPTGRAWIWVEE